MNTLIVREEANSSLRCFLDLDCLLDKDYTMSIMFLPSFMASSIQSVDTST